MQRLRTVTSLDVSAVAGHHAMPAALLLRKQILLGSKFFPLNIGKQQFQNYKTLECKLHVNNDIYNKYCLIHNTSPLHGKERFMK